MFIFCISYYIHDSLHDIEYTYIYIYLSSIYVWTKDMWKREWNEEEWKGIKPLQSAGDLRLHGSLQYIAVNMLDVATENILSQHVSKQHALEWFWVILSDFEAPIKVIDFGLAQASESFYHIWWLKWQKNCKFCTCLFWIFVCESLEMAWICT